MLDGQAFVAAVMARLEVTTAAQLADKMGWPRGKERLVAKWLAGNNRPSYRNMLEMIEKTGWLNIDEAVPVVTGEAPADPLAALATGVAALEKGQTEILRLLRAEKATRRSPLRASSTPKAASQ